MATQPNSALDRQGIALDRQGNVLNRQGNALDSQADAARNSRLTWLRMVFALAILIPLIVFANSILNREPEPAPPIEPTHEFDLAWWQPAEFEAANSERAGLGEDTISGTYAVTSGCLIITDVPFGLDEVLPVFSALNPPPTGNITIGEPVFSFGLLGYLDGNYVYWTTVNPHDADNPVVVTSTILGSVTGLTIPANCPETTYLWISS